MAGVETGGGVRRWLGMGWGSWMEEGGQAERSTRGGMRGLRGLRGEKLEKGRFKYQPPRGGPRARCFLSRFVLPSSHRRPSSSRSLALPPPRLPPFCHPSSFFAYAHTHIHTHIAHRKICTQTDAHAHIYRSSAREKAS